MRTPGALAQHLRTAYVEELTATNRPPPHKSLNAAQIRAMLDHVHDSDPTLYEEPDEKTWIWSDLHLGHEISIGAFGRPFHTAQAADKAMQRAWVERVAEDETIVCLGDITVDGCLRPHHVLRWQQAPGCKVLVLGNHDVDPLNQIQHLDIQQKTLALVAPGDPPLLLTHVPLIQVPHGTVNIHGHIHDKQSPTPNRHVNVSVEQLNYAPVKLKDGRRLARRLLEGRNVPAGERTGRRLDIVKETMP